MDWAKAENREDMNNLCEEWLKVYNALVEKLIGTRWARSLLAFIVAWETSNRDWYAKCVRRAIGSGDVAIWGLLSDKWKNTSRSMVDDKGTVLN